jgi:hypothetical protein
MSKEDDAPQERERVFARIAPLVMDYASSHAGEAFHAEELRQFVLERDPLIAPDSPGRILRELRLAGKIDYVVINRRQSLYQFRHLPWQLELL